MKFLGVDLARLSKTDCSRSPCPVSSAVLEITEAEKPKSQRICFSILCDNAGRGEFSGLEDYVAALNVSLYLFEAEGFERFSKIVHFNSFVAADVDSAQQ